MNAWNVRSAMNASKVAALLTAALFLPSCAHAQGSAPALFNVREVVVQYAHFADPKTADACSLTREDIADILNKTLTATGVPAISVADAKPPMMGTARIELVPEVSTINSATLDCTSWVSLTAESTSNVVVPPVDTARNVKVVYWHKGLMVTSGQSSHSKNVDDQLKKMATEFAQQYRLDQPPALPPTK